MGCSASHSRRREKGPAYLEDALVAGKGLGEDVKNGAAARPIVAAREERDREKGKVKTQGLKRRVREKGKVKAE